MATKAEKKLNERIDRDLRYSDSRISKLHKEIRNDFNFEQGNQWESQDVAALKTAGVRALTINKLKPIVKLLTGIERQSRSDFKAFPEGGEDQLPAEMVTRLLKNQTKRTKAEMKLSDQFKSGAIAGPSFLEPFIDYSFDLINGDLKWKKLLATQCWWDPDFKEYDMSDSKFFIKLTTDLSRDQVETLFPGQEKKINRIKNGKMDLGLINPGKVSPEYPTDYPKVGDGPLPEEGQSERKREDEVYDLLDYYYVELENKHFVVQQERGFLQQTDSKEEAEELAAKMDGQVFERKVPVVRLAQKIGTEIMDDDVAWSYPRWKRIPIIPFFAEFIAEELETYDLKIQGIIRGSKDIQLEFNKRRTQELNHLNSSQNSGFDIETGQLDTRQKALLKKFGSSAGFVVERKKGSPPLNRITPMPLSQGHAQLAAEHAQDLKEASGVNPDLLANDSQSQSGRAILFKQRQGLQMIQEMLDNLGETKRIMGRFMISQLAELFTVESAMKVLGDAFIADNYTVPVNIVLERAIKKVAEEEEPTEFENSILLQYPNQNPQQPVMDEADQFVTVVDIDTAIQTINQVLNDAELNKYDVAVGEGPFAETIHMANFTDLKELATQGVPIPPQALIEASMLPDAQKKKILQLLAQMPAPVEGA